MGRMTNAKIPAAEILEGGEQIRRLRDMFVQSPNFSALLQGPEHRFVLTNPAYERLIGHRNVIGLTVREAVPEAGRQGFIDLLDNVFATGKAFVGRNVEIVLQGSTDGPPVSFINRSRTRLAMSLRFLSKGPMNGCGAKIRSRAYFAAA